MELLYVWIGLTVGFIILELLTATFYGLSLALSSALVAVYVYVMKLAEMDISQGLIFAGASFVFAFLLPKYLKSKLPDTSQGIDTYNGQVRTAKKVGGDLKISLDGVDYLVESDEEIEAGDKVEIVGHHGVSMKVKKVKSK